MATISDRICLVYGLASSEDGVIRYVGQTTQRPNNRLSNHKDRARRGADGPRHNWIRKVWARGFDIQVIVLEECAEWDASEQLWIERLRSEGFDLLNLTKGGGQHFGYSLSKERKEKISAITAALWRDPSYRQRVAAGHQAIWTKERRDEQASRMRGAKRSEASKKRVSESLQAYLRRPGARQKSMALIEAARASPVRASRLAEALKREEYREKKRAEVTEIWRKRRLGLLPMPKRDHL